MSLRLLIAMVTIFFTVWWQGGLGHEGDGNGM